MKRFLLRYYWLHIISSSVQAAEPAESVTVELGELNINEKVDFTFPTFTSCI